MKLFVDMDGVLVLQTGRDHFDTMPWMPDGRQLWDAIKALSPTVLSMLRPDIYERCAPQKRVWCARELGPDVPVVVVPVKEGKGGHSAPGDVLIDDDVNTHMKPWTAGGGRFVWHRNTESTLIVLRALGVI